MPSSETWDLVRDDVADILQEEMKGLFNDSVLRENALVISESIRRYWIGAVSGDPESGQNLAHARSTLRLLLARQERQAADRTMAVLERVAQLVIKVLT